MTAIVRTQISRRIGGNSAAPWITLERTTTSVVRSVRGDIANRPRSLRPLLVLALVGVSALPAACGQTESKSAISANQREIARLRRENPEANRLLASSPADFQRRVREA